MYSVVFPIDNTTTVIDIVTFVAKKIHPTVFGEPDITVAELSLYLALCAICENRVYFPYQNLFGDPHFLHAVRECFHSGKKAVLPGLTKVYAESPAMQALKTIKAVTPTTMAKNLLSKIVDETVHIANDFTKWRTSLYMDK